LATGHEPTGSRSELEPYWILFRFQNDTRSYVETEQHGVRAEDAAPRSFRLGEEEGLVGLVGARAEPMSVPDVTREPRFLGFDPALRSAYLTPITLSNEGLGVLVVGSKAERGLDAMHRALADAFARERARSWAAERAGDSKPPQELDLSMLSQRERDVVLALRRGLRLSDIARVLGISNHTARNHLKHVFRKLGVHSQVELLSVIGARAGQ
jgi:DNA-binding CsgD family transcriptional regulator